MIMQFGIFFTTSLHPFLVLMYTSKEWDHLCFTFMFHAYHKGS